MTTSVRRGLLLCTSPLQIVNTRSVMDCLTDRDGVDRLLTVVIIHPMLIEQSKSIAVSIGRDLRCQSILDCSPLLKQFFPVGGAPPSLNHVVGSSAVRSAKSYIEEYERISETFREKVNSHVGPIDEIYCRIGASMIDKYCLKALTDGTQEVLGIEDGIGDYVSIHWRFNALNIHEIRHQLIGLTKSFGKFCILSIVSGNLRQSKNIALSGKVRFREKYSVLPRIGEVTISKHFVKNVQKLAQSKNHRIDRKIVIIGTLFDARFRFEVGQEIELYRKLIDYICGKHRVTGDQIWYKHHPRLEKRLWQKKKDMLNCQFFDHTESFIMETEFFNPNLIAVYSVGSTSHIYAKALFGIDSYFVNISKNVDVHPSMFKKAKAVAEKYAIPIIDL